MLVAMNQHVNNTQDVGSFLSVTLATCLVLIKRNFDRFVVSAKKEIFNTFKKPTG